MGILEDFFSLIFMSFESRLSGNMNVTTVHSIARVA